MMDWLGKMLKLPEAFLAGQVGEGGGVIQVRQQGRGPAPRDAGLHARAAAAGGNRRRRSLLRVLLENKRLGSLWT